MAGPPPPPGPAPGRVVQVDPIKPTLIAPGSERLKLNYDDPLSNFAFNFYLRRYNLGRRYHHLIARVVPHGYCPLCHPITPD